MAITYSFRKAVDDGDIKDIRIMLKESLLVDPSFADFNEKNHYAKNIRGVYVEHDGRELNRDETTWDEHYVDKLMAQLSTNFSRPRIDHLKKVIRKLYHVSAPQQTQPSQSSFGTSRRHPVQNDFQRKSTHPQNNNLHRKHDDQEDASYRGSKIALGVVAGGVLGGVIGGVVVSTTTAIIGSAAIGAVVGGAVAIIITKEGKN